MVDVLKSDSKLIINNSVLYVLFYQCSHVIKDLKALPVMIVVIKIDRRKTTRYAMTRTG